MRSPNTTLIIDADDTLWESNIHYQKATQEFLDLAESRRCDRRETARRLSMIESRNILLYGYGSSCFVRSLQDCLEESSGREVSADDLRVLRMLGSMIRNMPIEYLPNVEITLTQLKKRHRLILFTKGNVSEQSDKIERSGAKAYFHDLEISFEKKPSDYVRLIRRYELLTKQSWMIGNSPRSDINPALEVGLGAIFIPHSQMWELEDEEVRQRDNSRYKVLQTFSELLEAQFI